ncbi:MAG: hypothetical protein RL213_327 [Bacteroidota bacterium]|jgi:PKD repeat protein
MKKTLLALVAFVWASGLNGYAEEKKKCFTDEYYRESVAQDPSILVTRQQLEDFTSDFIAQQKSERLSNGNRTSGGPATYVIPVVFHVLHQYGPENISDAQIQDCIRHMNEDFRKLNPDTINIIPQFQGISVDCEIEFRLATLDPNGNCTNGIDRIYTSKTISANNNSKLNPWPNNKYLNIWTALSLENTGAAAYAHLPGTASASVDGIMSRHDYIGTIGTSGSGGLHTISHETGHHLNLLHTWGSTNSPGVSCGDDFVNDTPITQGWTSCNLSGAVCDPAVIENVQNFMEYSYCDCMFSAGQRNRMWACLNSGVMGRNNLWTPANLAATGVANWPPTTICAPKADFYAVKQTVCEGRSVTFTDYSWNGHPTSWQWICPGGTPSTSVDSNPTITYNTAGIYDVTLIASNATGTDTFTRAGFVRVNGTVGAIAPVLNSFNLSADFPGNGGWVKNFDANTVTWDYFATAGANGTTGCIKMNNWSNTAGQIDEYITPGYDISNLTGVKLRFFVAHAERSSSTTDLLRIFTSPNCGETWTPTSYQKSGTTLATITTFVPNTGFTPTATQWRRDSINLNGISPRTNIRLKFQNTSDRGNNTYIDEFEITGTPNNADEIDEVTTGFGLYPNPTSGPTTVQFKINSTQRVVINILDMAGRLIETVSDEVRSPDLYEVPVSLGSKGIFMVDVTVGDKHHVRRIVVTD